MPEIVAPDASWMVTRSELDAYVRRRLWPVSAVTLVGVGGLVVALAIAWEKHDGFDTFFWGFLAVCWGAIGLSTRHVQRTRVLRAYRVGGLLQSWATRDGWVIEESGRTREIPWGRIGSLRVGSRVAVVRLRAPAMRLCVPALLVGPAAAAQVREPDTDGLPAMKVEPGRPPTALTVDRRLLLRLMGVELRPYVPMMLVALFAVGLSVVNSPEDGMGSTSLPFAAWAVHLVAWPVRSWVRVTRRFPPGADVEGSYDEHLYVRGPWGAEYWHRDRLGRPHVTKNTLMFKLSFERGQRLVVPRSFVSPSAD